MTRSAPIPQNISTIYEQPADAPVAPPKTQEQLKVEQRDEVFRLRTDLESRSNSGDYPRALKNIEGLCALWGSAENKKTLSTVLSSLNQRRARFMTFGYLQGPLSKSSSTVQPTTLNVTSQHEDGRVKTFTLGNRRGNSAIFATDQKRAFDAVLNHLMPKKNLEGVEFIHAGDYVNLDFHLDNRPAEQRKATPAEAERRNNLAPAWNSVFENLAEVKEERQNLAYDAFTFTISDHPHRENLIPEMGAAFNTLLRQQENLSTSIQRHIPHLLKVAFQKMSDGQKHEVISTYLASSALRANTEFAFIEKEHEKFVAAETQRVQAQKNSRPVASVNRRNAASSMMQRRILANTHSQK